MVTLIAILSQVSDAAAASSGGDGEIFKNILTAVNLGLAGLGLWAFLRGWIVPGYIYKNSEMKREKAEEEYREMVDTIQKEFLPELERGRNANQSLAILLEKLLTKFKN